ncbi:MAG: DJ-1/PfpI family protein [Armatimonadetes bacterium]|nr:DJ-1/PfpI family protein [Armatimonadota bacterium]
MKKILIIIAPEKFRDEEYQKPREILESEFLVKVASNTKNFCKGRFGLEVKPDLILEEIKAKDYEAVIFVGGEGSRIYFNDFLAHKIALDFYNAHKIVAAICIAPMILAASGILKGKKSAVYASEIENLKSLGVYYSASSIEKVDNIITANGPEAAEEFGYLILKSLKG